MQRIVQRDTLEREDILSGRREFNLSSIDATNVNIYVIDSGILIDHEEFQSGNAVYGVNIEDPTAPATDCDGHGTHVAALAVGAYSGVATKARVIAVRVLNCEGHGSCSHILEALEWVAIDSRSRVGRSVVVMSVGSTSKSCLPTRTATQWLWDHNIVTVAAAGNEQAEACFVFPAENLRTIAVGAFDVEDKIYEKSNYGPCIDILAPGVNILSAWGNGSRNEYKVKSGTSMAAPIVAGLAAIMLGADKTLSPIDVLGVLLLSGTKNKISEFVGYRRRTSTVNKIVFAPWSMLFSETNMDHDYLYDPTGLKNSSIEGDINHDLWNTSASFASLTLSFTPRTRPAMQYSVSRIMTSILLCMEIRLNAILPRRAAGVKRFSNGSEPTAIKLKFYIALNRSFSELYRSRLVDAAKDGKLQRLSSEQIHFTSTVEEAVQINVKVPFPASNVTYLVSNPKVISGQASKRSARTALICFGAFVLICVVALIAFVGWEYRRHQLDLKHLALHLGE